MGWVMGFEPTNTGTTIRGLRPLGDTHHILLSLRGNAVTVAISCKMLPVCQKGLV